MNDAKEELLDALSSMVRQYCSFDDEAGSIPTYCSGFIRADADAMRVLAKYERFIINFDDGSRSVYGRFKYEQSDKGI